MKQILIIFLTLTTCTLMLYWLNKAPNPYWNTTQVNELKANIRPINIYPSDTNYTDLQFLKERIGNSKLVCLGEVTHNDGSGFEAKTRIIQFLHQELGFDVLLMEAGTFDVWHMNQEYLRTDTLKPSLGMYHFWSKSTQMQYLWKYIEDQKIDVDGFDFQFSGNITVKKRLELLQTYAHSKNIDLKQYPVLYTYFDKMPTYDFYLTNNMHKIDRDSLEADFNNFTTQLLPLQNAEDTLFYNYLMRLNQWMKVNVKYKIGDFARFTIRDSIMAQQAIALIEGKYQNRKVIIWAANLHLLYNPAAADSSIFTTMGHLLKKRYANSYTLCGTWNTFRTSPAGVYTELVNQTASSHSIENAFHKTKVRYAILDYKSVDPTSFLISDTLKTRLFSNTYVRGLWSEMTDGILYIDTMHCTSY